MPIAAPSPEGQGPRIGFWIGLLGAILIIAFGKLGAPHETLTPQAVYLIGVTFLVGTWWVTEALPLGATALVPLAAFPLLNIATAKQTAPAYGSPLILLLLGGFLLALAVERSAVHRRLALYVLLLVGGSPRRLVLGFAIAAATLSMWISNTATTLIMMPIALAVSDRATSRVDDPKVARSFAIAVLLATGYGASIGGMGTPVGTPPNLVAIDQLNKSMAADQAVTFVSWAISALPVVVLVVPLMWILLVSFYPKVPKSLELGTGSIVREELAALGEWRASERRSLFVFGLAAVLWVTRPDLKLGADFVIQGWQSRLGIQGAHDSTVAMLAACIAFALPSGERDGLRLLPWADALRVPWGLVLLFGGGVALATGFKLTGLDLAVGRGLAGLVGDAPRLFVAVASLAGTFGTEIVSNTALANILMPVLSGTAKAAQIDPRLLLIPVALACSCAFMMPAATGPNAIVFGTGRIRISEMVKAGFIINWVAWAVIVIIAAVRFA